MSWRVEVTPKNAGLDSEGKDVLTNARDLHIKGLEEIRTGWIFMLDDDLTDEQVRLLADKLLSDPIEHLSAVLSGEEYAELIPGAQWEVEVHYKPGVTDTTAESLARGAEDLGVEDLKEVHTGRIYWLFGDIASEDVERLSSGLLANGIVQDYSIRAVKSD